MSTDQPPSPTRRTTGPGLRVVALVIGGVAINKLSDLVDATAPIVLFGSFLALLGVLAYEARQDGGVRRTTRGIDSDVDLAVFALTNLLLGALISGVAVLPVFREHRIVTSLSLARGHQSTFFNYELLAVAVVTVLAIVPAWRRKPPLQLAAFVIPATSGMTLALVTLKPENLFLTTFATWTAVIGLVVALIYLRDLIFGLYKSFFFKEKERVEDPEVGDADRLD